MLCFSEVVRKPCRQTTIHHHGFSSLDRRCCRLSLLPAADELFENAFGKPRGSHVQLDWSKLEDLSSSDNEAHDEIEEAMYEEWVKAVEREHEEIEKDGEEFFHGL